MKKLFLFFFLTASCIAVKSQKLSIDGKVEDAFENPIESATVYLLKQKDSAVINYTSTSREGNFSLKLDHQEDVTFLKIEKDKFMPFSKRFESINADVALGTLQLKKDSVFNIEEVRISASPVKIKKDTIEFNAKAIKVRPDSKVEELLKQIPGIEIGNDGKVTANGKEVDQIMINGKPFFDKDGKIALQNIPADLVKNIQITTTKTKQEETTGKTPKSNNATINLTIDDKKNKGFISRITAGYGTDKRYEGSALLSYFNNDTKISLLASSNNINSQGFSSDEVFDSMGSGRNSWLMQGATVVTRGNTTYYSSGGGPKGIQRSTVVGLNYSDKVSKEADLENVSLILLENNSENRSKVSRSTLLPEYTLNTTSENSGENDSRQFNFDSSIRIRPDSLTSIYVSPSFSYNKGFSLRKDKSETSKNMVSLNKSNSYQQSDSEGNSFNSNIYFSRKLNKKGRSITAGISNNFNSSDNDNIIKSNTLFFQGNQQDDIRNQLSENKTLSSSNEFNVGYNEPVSDSATVGFEIKYSNKLENNLRNVNDFDAFSGSYSLFSNLLSNDMRQKSNVWTPEFSFDLSKKKLVLWSSVNLEMNKMAVISSYNGKNYSLEKNYILPNYHFNLSYNFSDRKRLSIFHYSNFQIPSAEQLTPYEDLSNPLISFKGNPELKPTWSNQTHLYFSNFNMIKNVNYYLNAGFNYNDNSVSNYSFYDGAGKQYVTYTNVSGNKSVNAGFGLTKTYKWKEHKIAVNPRFNTFYNFTKGFIEGEQFSSNRFSISPSLMLTYELKEKMTIKPSFSWNYNFSKYNNYTVDEVSNSYSQMKLELTNYFLKSNLVIGNDFQYNSNSNIAPGFKKDFYFWNTSIGYSFFKKQFTAKLKVYDVLNQNQSVTRSITNTYVEDREDLILKRYLMFSVTMKLNKFGGKNKD